MRLSRKGLKELVLMYSCITYQAYAKVLSNPHNALMVGTMPILYRRKRRRLRLIQSLAHNPKVRCGTRTNPLLPCP